MSDHNLTTTSLYPPLPSHGNHIRLLVLHRAKSSFEISCTLTTGDLTKHIHYDALSYTWGSPHQTQYILVNGVRMQVRQNLYDFLSRIRQQDEDRVLWADAICIDQSSNEEKNQQVRKMHLIFERAGQVLVWLGSGVFDEQTTTLLRIMSVPEKVDLVLSQHFEFYLSALQRLLQLFYWNRTWIIQEYILAKQMYLFFGNLCIYELDFYDSWMAIKSCLERFSNGSTSPGAYFHLQVRYQAAACLQLMSESNLSRLLEYRSRWASHSVVRFKFYDLLLDFQYTECTDRRDKVYALLSLVEDDDPWKEFEIDYEAGPVSLLYRALALSDTPCDMTDRTLWSSILGVVPDQAFLTTKHLPSSPITPTAPLFTQAIQAHLSFQGHVLSHIVSTTTDTKVRDYVITVASDGKGRYCSKYVSGTPCRRGDLVFDIAQAHVFIIAEGRPSDTGSPRIKGLAFAAHELNRYASDQKRKDMFHGAGKFAGMRLKKTDDEQYFIELDAELWDMISAYHMQRMRTEQEIYRLQAQGFTRNSYNT